MTRLDLDAKRAARSEAENSPHEVVFGGEVFALPPRMPLECLDLMKEGEFRAAFRLLLGDEDAAARFMRHRPDDADLTELMSLYGEAPESLASAPSLSNGGRPLRPTSPPPTGSTSPPAATAPTSAAPAGS